MPSSLVGSEMCIRDRHRDRDAQGPQHPQYQNTLLMNINMTNTKRRTTTTGDKRDRHNKDTRTNNNQPHNGLTIRPHNNKTPQRTTLPRHRQRRQHNKRLHIRTPVPTTAHTS
eukprot:12428413-Prorocentrum_lima.AAC.1